MAYILDYDTDAVLAYVRRTVPGLSKSEDMTAIGLRRHGVLVAGVIYEGFNGRNVWMHVAGRAGRQWLTRGYLRACFVYPFMVAKVDRVSGYVNASNADSVRFVEHLGFRREATLQGAAPDGGDVWIYVMWAADWQARMDKRRG